MVCKCKISMKHTARFIWRHRYCIFFLFTAIVLLQLWLVLFYFPVSNVDKDLTQSKKDVLHGGNIQPWRENDEKIKTVETEDDLSHIQDTYNLNAGKDEIRLIYKQLRSDETCELIGKHVNSAYHRATSKECKELLLRTSCSSRNGTLYPSSLPHSCPSNGLQKDLYLGCYKDSNKQRLLSGSYYNFSGHNSPAYCTSKCIQAGFSYAGVQYKDECFCGNDKPSNSLRLNESSCNFKCHKKGNEICGGFYTMNVFETGVAKFMSKVANENFLKIKKPSQVRIVYLLQLNGRAIRQVIRLIKILYHVDHYFFIHVDARQEYMFKELMKLERRFPNIRLSRRRYNTIWGGVSLLSMLLQAMSDIAATSWHWDFIINLSETDFPIKTNLQLVSYLSENKDGNFVRSHNRNVLHFIQKQGLDKTFVQCDNHMWRVDDRDLPYGIVIDGGSDWFVLSREFVEYIVKTMDDPLLSGLVSVFKYTLLPAESFFHTTLRNSIYCSTYIDNNLRLTNWIRKSGCQCQYKHVVDWCGCSPNVFKLEEWHKLQNTKEKPIFFARKFEAVISQAMLDKMENWMYGPSIGQLDKNRNYWENMYHHQDKITDDALFTICNSLGRLAGLDISENNEQLFVLTTKTLEVHSFHSYDRFQGILVLYEIILDNDRIQMETLYKHAKDKLIIKNNVEISKRLKSVTVSSSFDAKEQVSRDFIKCIGINSELILIHEWKAGKIVGNVTLLWLDPFETMAAHANVSINNQAGVRYIKANTAKPLVPGVWKVYLVYEEQLFSQLSFLVLPLEVLNGKKIYTNDINVNGGLEEKYEQLSPNWKAVIGNRKTYSQNDRNDYFKRLTSNLKGWIDEHVYRFYNKEVTCLVNDEVADKYELEQMEICDDTEWSSLSPDPRSSIIQQDVTTGRLL